MRGQWVKAALIATADGWACIDELPSGNGFVDVAYVPRRGSGRPAIQVELTWDKPVDAAIGQVLNRNYPLVLLDLTMPLLLVGITYDAVTKRHVCQIELAEYVPRLIEKA